MTPAAVVRLMAQHKPLPPGYYEHVLVGEQAQQRFSRWEQAHNATVKMLAAKVDKGFPEHWYNPASWFAPHPPSQEYVKFQLTAPTPWLRNLKGMGVPSPADASAPTPRYIEDALGESHKSWWQEVQEEAGKLGTEAAGGAEQWIFIALALWILFKREE